MRCVVALMVCHPGQPSVRWPALSAPRAPPTTFPAPASVVDTSHLSFPPSPPPAISLSRLPAAPTSLPRREGADCRYDHPEELGVWLNEDGYPHRPLAQQECLSYARSGWCSLGPRCLRHHPLRPRPAARERG